MTLQPWHDLWRTVQPGQRVTVRYDGPIYEGRYTTFIQHAGPQGLRVDMPLEDGRLVLLPVGAMVYLSIGPGHEELPLYIHDRFSGQQRAFQLGPEPVMNEKQLPPSLADWPMESPDLPKDNEVPVLAVTSGKGGVGKSTFVVNIAVALAEMGYRPCIIDADLGTANVDVLLKLSPPFNLSDVILGKKHMVEVVVEGPKGILVLPGGSGLQSLTTLTDEQYEVLAEQFRSLNEFADIVLIDTGSGVSPGVTNFIKAASAAILVTTPEPPAVTDAYALLKVLAEDDCRQPMHLVVNRAHSPEEGAVTLKRMEYAAERFLQYELTPLGTIKEDAAVAQAVRQQIDVLTGFPRSEAARDWRHLGTVLAERLGWQQPDTSPPTTTGFIQRLKSYFTTGGRS